MRQIAVGPQQRGEVVARQRADRVGHRAQPVQRAARQIGPARPRVETREPALAPVPLLAPLLLQRARTAQP
ncbi:hypothetical protein [Streptomyces sp. KL118A]|uniref:hypothetical protein n=1 Tax=Streptomyces sp. KL118A TaxID=3045153 RepID=UPI00278C0F5D|nr:hypothetical protein [Streptomyces sp. KL118A]